MSANPPCVLRADNWCERHQRYHVGRIKQLALMPGEPGASYRTLWDGSGGVEKPQERSLECFHLGDVLDKLDCNCPLRWVHECDKHGRCTVGVAAEGMPCCRTKCADYTAEPPAPPAPAFGRVVLINLKRRPDRLEAFRAAQRESGWPLPEVQVFEAIDGDRVGVPRYYLAGGGAWGCLRSHCAVLERAVMDGVGSVLVLEDDVCWDAGTWDALARFLREVPGDWEQLMLGGQHMAGTRPVKPGIVQCANCHRTHAYAVRGRALQELLSLWYKTNGHIDHAMGPWQAGYRVYAPDPFLFGQGRGRSDISGAVNPRKTWNPPPKDLPVVVLSAPGPVVAELRAKGLHAGYSRDPATDLDLGLIEVAKLNWAKDALRHWLDIILWEVASEPGLLATAWHPDLKADLVREVYEGPVIAVKGATAEECLRQLSGFLKDARRE